MDFMGETKADSIDSLIVDLGGCGMYQLVITFLIGWVKIASSFSMMVMAFGNYNPGWECLDNSTDAHLNISISSANTTGVVDVDECNLFKSCSNVKFTPGVSTIVTEWNLMCDRSWAASLIVSAQMAGVFIGSYLMGYFGDKFGRKSVMYAATVFHAAVNVIAIFSNSWQMFAVMRLLIGMAIPAMLLLPILLAIELSTIKWRNRLGCFPFWPVGCILFALSAMATEDWRYIHAIAAAFSLVCVLPCYWVPESLRWLTVKDKIGHAHKIVKNIAKLNRVKEQGVERLQSIASVCRAQTKSNDGSCLHLLKRGSRLSTVVVGFSIMSMSLIYYALSFGVKSLPGNLYVNMMVMYIAEVPTFFVSSTLPNYIGRKPSIILFLTLASVGLFTIVGLDLGADGSLKTTGVLLCAILARAFIDAAWDIVVTVVGELYPTVIRSTSIAYGSCVARVGGILAPYIIPNDPDTYFINYLIMASLAFTCCGLLLLLPETKGKPLHDTWEVTVVNPVMAEKLIEKENGAQKENGARKENGDLKENGTSHV